jgi:hypothetical protein
MTALSDWDVCGPSGSDADLARASAAGDMRAFAVIYDRYADRLHDFCVGMLADRDGAADCVQDTFCIAATRLPLRHRRRHQPRRHRRLPSATAAAISPAATAGWSRQGSRRSGDSAAWRLGRAVGEVYGAPPTGPLRQERRRRFRQESAGRGGSHHGWAERHRRPYRRWRDLRRLIQSWRRRRGEKSVTTARRRHSYLHVWPTGGREHVGSTS